MRWSLLPFLAAACPAAQVTFIPDHATLIANPERGYHATVNAPGPGSQDVDVFETTTACWTPALSQSTMTSNRTGKGITLQAVRYNLANWRDADISQAFLDRMAADAAAARAAGVKLIIRFVYGWVGSRPDASRDRTLGHIEQLAPVLAAQQDVIAWIDAGFVGRWGEWNGSSNGLLGPYDPADDLYGDNVTADSRAILDRLFLRFPAQRAILFRYARMKSQYFHPSAADPWWDVTPMPGAAQARDGSAVSRAGNLCDSFLSDELDGTYGYGTNQTAIANLANRLRTENQFVPHCGELDMGLGQTATLNTAANAVRTLGRLEQFRWTGFNLLDGSNQSSFQTIWQTAGCIPATASITGTATTLYDEAHRRLGYRLALVGATLPDAMAPGAAATVGFTVRNHGFTAPVLPRTVRLVLRSASGAEIATTVNADPRTWLPGSDIAVAVPWTLPAGMAAGTWTLFLHLPDPAPSLAGRVEYAIRLANGGGIWEYTTGYHRLGTVAIAAGSGPSLTAPAAATPTAWTLP
ncbi:MAG: hypothetical protein RLZZ127_1382 [Planctomycetota bacterium]|jgi:hypothetical protein